MNWFKSFWKALNTPMGGEPRQFEVRPAASVSASTMNNFTPRAQQVLALARQEADRFNHNFVGTEHLLLGLIRLGQGTAFNALGRMGVDLENVRSEVEKQVGEGPAPRILGNIPYTPRVKKVLALAAKEARALNHTYLGTEHILLGLLREGDGVAARVLKGFELDLDVTRQSILRELDPNFSPAPDIIPMKEKTEPRDAHREPIDVSKRYDVYCREGDQEVIYRNALFKGVKMLLPKNEYQVLSEYLELEQSDGQTIFIARPTVVKFCESSTTPGSENRSTGST